MMTKTGLVLIHGLLMTVTGCMTHATVELTKAPFDAITHLTDGTSRAIGEFLDPLTEFTSSTTPGASADTHLLRAKQKATIFAMHTHENLRTDIARGQGEYLASLATLVGVPAAHWTNFQTSMKASYTELFDGDMSVAQASLRVVEAAWASGYGMQSAVDR